MKFVYVWRIPSERGELPQFCSAVKGKHGCCLNQVIRHDDPNIYPMLMFYVGT